MQLGLPTRDYFLKDSSAEALQAYHKYMSEVAVLLGANKSTAPFELLKIIEFEIELANVSIINRVNVCFFPVFFFFMRLNLFIFVCDARCEDHANGNGTARQHGHVPQAHASRTAPTRPGVRLENVF